jgi:hypothetical protein
MLDRTTDLIRRHQPVVVLSALWLAETLATEMPILALVERQKHTAASRAMRRARKRSLPLTIVVAGAEVPLGKHCVGSVLLENLIDIEETGAASDLLVGLLPSLLPDALVISLDATKNPSLEARVSEVFLAASLTQIRQMRPRDGALLTYAVAPGAEVVQARTAAFLLGT